MDERSASFFYHIMEKQTKQPKVQCKARVVDHIAISSSFRKIRFSLDKSGSLAFKDVMPGQFAQFDLTCVSLPPREDIPAELVDKSQKNIILSRPFSFSDVTCENDTNVLITVLYCVLGPATLRMTTLKKGDLITIIGPLGNGFWIPAGIKYALLVAGGMGAPPLQHLAKFLSQKHPEINTIAFAGAQNLKKLPYFNIKQTPEGVELREFASCGISSCVATDDGSVGFKGFVTDCLLDWFNRNKPKSSDVTIYSCGPEPMLKAVAQIAQKKSINCQVSMERTMGCGIGLCQSCAVEVKNPNSDQRLYKLCCKQGPVFDSAEVLFE